MNSSVFFSHSLLAQIYQHWWENQWDNVAFNLSKDARSGQCSSPEIDNCLWMMQFGWTSKSELHQVQKKKVCICIKNIKDLCYLQLNWTQNCWAALSHRIPCSIFFTTVFSCFWSSCNSCQTTKTPGCAGNVSRYRCGAAEVMMRDGGTFIKQWLGVNLFSS